MKNSNAMQRLEIGTDTCPDLPVIDSEPAFDFLAAEYLQLFEASGATAFQHPVWLNAFYGQLARHRQAEKCVITGRSASGELVLVLPLIKRRHTGLTLLESCDLGVSDYAAPVVSPEMAGQSLSAVVRTALPAHDILRIRPVRAEHVASWRKVLGIDAQRLDFSAHAAILDDNFIAWRDKTLAPGFLRTLDRKKKRFLKQDGAQVRLLTKTDEIRAGIARLARLRAGRFDGDVIQSAEVERFYADVAVAGSGSGFARTYEIGIEGETIGCAFGIADAGRFNYLLIGCDYDSHGRHSPGLLLYDGMIEDWIANDGNIYDFTIGDEPFKQQFGTMPTPMYVLSQNATWRGRLGAAAFAARQSLRRLRTRTGEIDNA